MFPAVCQVVSRSVYRNPEHVNASLTSADKQHHLQITSRSKYYSRYIKPNDGTFKDRRDDFNMRYDELFPEWMLFVLCLSGTRWAGFNHAGQQSERLDHRKTSDIQFSLFFCFLWLTAHLTPWTPPTWLCRHNETNTWSVLFEPGGRRCIQWPEASSFSYLYLLCSSSRSSAGLFFLSFSCRQTPLRLDELQFWHQEGSKVTGWVTGKQKGMKRTFIL